MGRLWMVSEESVGRGGKEDELDVETPPPGNLITAVELVRLGKMEF